jgi:hypothetical protein
MSRTIATPIVGVDAQFTMQAVNNLGVLIGSPIVLWNSDWEITPSNAIAEAPNTTDGMVRAAGLNDWKGKVSGKTNVNTLATPVEGNVMPGFIFFFTGYRSKGSNLFWTGYLIVGENLSIKAGTGTTEEWSFDFAKAYGFLTLPNGNVF